MFSKIFAHMLTCPGMLGIPWAPRYTAKDILPPFLKYNFRSRNRKMIAYVKPAQELSLIHI